MEAKINTAISPSSHLRRLTHLLVEDLRAKYGGDLPDAQVTRAAEAWVLSTAFVQFAEDNGLLDRALAPPGPTADWRSWLLSRFDAFARVDPATGWFSHERNPLYTYIISNQAARELAESWQQVNDKGSAGDLADPDLDTRFLGDLYQTLSEGARRQYGLVQTPAFVAEFILDLTLEPAIRDFGHDAVRIIDPVCGSGHFLLEAFKRLLQAWMKATPVAPVEDLIGQALSAVHGVDLNPFAAAVTRYRLLIAAIRACGATTLAEVAGRNWPFNISVGDSLTDDYFPGDFHVVVGNPPYLTVQDKALDQLYRSRYDACTGKYSLAVPFAQRFFQLARPGGYVGQLTANSFMKREFGRKLAEEFFGQRVTLTHVIDTSGAYIPGHATPTVVLIGRNQPPTATDPILVVLGVRGEPAIPADPAQAVVWQSLRHQTTHPGTASTWTASRYIDRKHLQSFPWRLATNEAAEVLDGIAAMPDRLHQHVRRIGYFANTGSDDLFTAPRRTFARLGIAFGPTLVPVVTGSEVRDWTTTPNRYGFFPYDHTGQIIPIDAHPGIHERLWPYRTVLRSRSHHVEMSYAKSGRPWYSWHQMAGRPGSQSRMITYSWVATHNHFAALPDGAVPLHSAPVIELPPEASPQRRTELVALLNSSTVCFWLKHGSNSKGRPDVDQTGSGEAWDSFYEITATRLHELPLPADLHTTYATELSRLARELAATAPAAVLTRQAPTLAVLNEARVRWDNIRSRMVSLQEELDWETYARYGLLEDDALLAPGSTVPSLAFGERAFEIVMAERIETGELRTTWFKRHDAVPVTELPAHWPTTYRDVVRRRINAIRRDDRVRALEQPEFKRRWASPSWDDLQSEALQAWLLDRCESATLWYDEREGSRRPRALTVATLTERLSTDPMIVEAAELYEPDKRFANVIRDLVSDEHVPYLAALRYRDAAMAKRNAWEEVWRLQQEEDTAHNHEDPQTVDLSPLQLPHPPRYTSADFLKLSYWRHRGKYDVPNERFVSYPKPGPPGRDILLGWAGWTYEDQAQVLVDLISSSRENEGAVVPLLAGLYELLPWVQRLYQHRYRKLRMFLDESMRQLNLSENDLIDWRPPKSKRGRPRKDQ